MESQEFIVLYTHQKMKKSKVWQDGILKITHLGNKAILYDDKGGCLESLFLKCPEVKPGDDLESDRYLITVEEVKVAGSTAVKQDVIKEAPALNSKRFMSSGRSLGCQPAGLKRKFTGFQGPRQVPKKMVITENSEPAASLESEKPGPVFLSPLYSTPPLFSTIGKKDASSMPTDSENIVTYKNRERNGIPFSSVISTPSFKINPEVLCEENYVCSPVSSVNKHSDSLLTDDESMKRDSLASHGLGVSQNIRSKAQILALLKSTSTSTSKELNSEIIGHFPQIQPQGSLEIPEQYAEVKSTESLHNQHQSENAMRNKSRWAMYLSSQSSPAHSSTVDGKDTEEKPKTQEGNLNLKDLSMQKGIQFFETCAEKGKRYNEDKPIDDNDQSWDQEGKLEIPSLYEHSSLPINCSIVVNDGLLLDSDIQKNNKRSVDQNDQIGKKGSILLRKKAQETNINGTPEKKCEHLQVESSLSNNSGISDDIFSKSSTNNESLSSIHEPMSDISQPLVEVTFNLNNFETSDTEEESQESSKISQDSEDWVKAPLVNSSNSRCENISCKEVGSEHLPLLASIGGKLSETFLMKEILPSQFCDRTCVGYDTGTWKAGNTGKERKEVCSDTLSNFDSSLEWTDDRYVENDEGANKSISASFPSKSESMNANLHIPHFLNIAADQKPENNLFSEQAQTRPFIVGSDLDKNTNQCNCSHIAKELEPVEFQGHQVKGSASSAVMVRGHSSQVECSQVLDGTVYESRTTNACSLTPALPSTCMQTDFLQVMSPEQKISTLSPVSTLSFNSRDDDFMLEFSEESLKTQTLPGNVHFLNKNLQRLSFEVSRTRAPLVTLPPASGPPDLDSCSFMMDCDRQKSSGSPIFSLCEESAVPSFSFGPKDQMTPSDVSLLDNTSTQSKWLKYQNTRQCNLTAPDRVDEKVTDGFFAEAVSGMHFSNTGERENDAVNESSLDSVHLQMMKHMLQQQHQDSVCRKKAFSLNINEASKTEEIQNLLGEYAYYNCSLTGGLQEVNDSELCFPSGPKVKSACLPQRQIHIPAVFQSPAHYKQIFTSCLTEHLNILLFGLAQRLHKALSKVDISFYTSSDGDKLKNVDNNVPSCHHQQPAKLVMVKKEGPNKGRLFYTCDGPKANQCKFFKWFEEMTPAYSTQEKSLPSMVLSDIKSIGFYLRSQNIPLYEECQLFVRKGFDFQRKRYSKLKKFTAVDPEFYNEPKSKLYLKLSRKESSSAYSKDDLWVVSKTLDFELDTFIACSTFFGPSSINEVELLPLKGYFPSNWPTNTVVHALLVCNASTELTTLKNIRDYFNPATLPLTQYLIAMSSSTTMNNKRVNKRKFIPPAFSNINTKFELLSIEATLKLASELIQAHKLNKDQAAALIQIAQMMASRQSVEEAKELATHTLPITIIHGVFGAGKSYLLAVVILFFVQLFEKCEALTVGNPRPWKLLISSSTNVAVDRVLLGLLLRGSLPWALNVHAHFLYAGSENENEQLKELHALMKEDLTPVERVYVRKSIEQHKLGTNKTLLKQVRVVGVTCAACPFPCMNDLKFPVVVLDECSQMTEPASLLPIARFECEKLILVGDPKQLPPTIQGSDAAHENGLEQTLFDRLCLMGHKPILLRTQYRCHPTISAIANDLFYEGNLMNGISETERSPLLEWLPTLCFYNVKGLEQIERGNSFHNVAEAAFTLKLIQSLIASGIAGSMIGVITLYKSQMYKLCHLLSAVDFDHPNMKAVQVSTVDAFQGAEKEIIILSCVRTRQVGFIDSEKRMNVALTRGRRHLLIVGNLACLRKNRLWGRVIQHCEGREGGLQHASQYEPQLDHLLKDYLEKQAEEKQKKKAEKDKLTDKKSYSQKDMV
uniref:5'-3' DNA helicase ZGRF1 n=1 Tax=Capra hircus TaxID=9925 RepID=A0A452E0U2_CAPHI